MKQARTIVILTVSGGTSIYDMSRLADNGLELIALANKISKQLDESEVSMKISSRRLHLFWKQQKLEKVSGPIFKDGIVFGLGP